MCLAEGSLIEIQLCECPKKSGPCRGEAFFGDMLVVDDAFGVFDEAGCIFEEEGVVLDKGEGG